MIRTALADFVSLIFPQVCLACDEPLARGDKNIYKADKLKAVLSKI